VKIVVGLGNPGLTYAKTRHNIGFELVDALARSAGVSVTNRRDRALTAKISLGGQSVLLVKPQTFMNLSGESVSAILQKEEVPLSELLVICDDIHLPVGRLRIRAKGSSGGQNGLKSVAAKLESEEWARLRLGVGEPQGGQIDWVLSRFSSSDRKTIDELLIAAMGAVEVWASEGVIPAASRFNALDLGATP
jgi:peptidyl-tRNA hydrolase, PTH1 family